MLNFSTRWQFLQPTAGIGVFTRPANGQGTVRNRAAADLAVATKLPATG
ncbi:MAG: hypothetical protein [Olavius algarvensis Delta 4 endosymbiont]|nr:MAG: hypothetical protein [Olavius algarvensis Delta 4 endosymbiont]